MKTFLLAEENKTPHVRQAVLKKIKLVRDTAFDRQLTETRSESLWVTESFEAFRKAFSSAEETIYKRQVDLRRHVKILLIADTPLTAQRSLEAIFKEAIVISHEFALPLEELLEVIGSKNAEDYIIGGQVDETIHTITLIRGDLSKLAVPFSSFCQTREGAAPDFTKLSIDDFGQTVKLGNYEASVDAILYEFDPIYRKKRKKELAQKDKSFGACLRRLRIQKGLKQTDFPDIDPREIGRIERGEVKPHKSTLEKIAKTLDVDKKEIRSY